MFRMAALAGALALGGCALPPALSIASFAADGVSYALTGKSVSDHGISLAMQEDCTLLNLLRSNPICSPGPHPEFGPVTHHDGQRANTLMAAAQVREREQAEALAAREVPKPNRAQDVASVSSGRAASTASGDEPLWSGPIE